MKYLFYVYIALFSTFLGAFPSDNYNPNNENADYNIKFYHLSLEFSLKKAFIAGTVKVDFVALKDGIKELTLDLGEGLKVTKVKGSNSFKQEGEKLIIQLTANKLKKDERSSVTVSYEGTPVNVKVDVDGKKVEKGLLYAKRGENTTIITACYPQLGYKWFPCSRGISDKVDSIYVDVTIADTFGIATIDEKKQKVPYIAVSNGVLDGVTKTNGKKTFHWKHRHRIAPHHMVVAIAPYAKVDAEFKSRDGSYPLEFYIFPENYDEAKATIARLPEIMDCLTRTFGNYPYADERFAVIETGLPLGLDGLPTQTAVLVEDLKSFHMFQVVHQAASMWFGNHISPDKWQDAWITEALATYAEAMWQEYKRGLTVYQIILDEKEFFGPGKLYLDNSIDYSKERLSQKGMYVIHMLRGIMGDNYFFETLKGITGQKRKRTTRLSTEDFKEICEYYASENVDQDFTYFFNQWVYGEYYPIYEMTFEPLKKGEVKVLITQMDRITKPNFFTMPVKVKVYFEDGSTADEVLLIDAVKKEFNLKYAKTVVDMEFDPSNWVFKELHWTRKKMSTKTNIEKLRIETSEDRRTVTLNLVANGKQDVLVELIRKADGVAYKDDVVVAKQAFAKLNGDKTQAFKIPLDAKERAVFELRITGKSDVYKRTLRIKRLVSAFE